MAVEPGAGRDEANPAGTRVHKMKKYVDVENGAYNEKSLTAINYAEVQKAHAELVRSYLS